MSGQRAFADAAGWPAEALELELENLPIDVDDDRPPDISLTPG